MSIIASIAQTATVSQRLITTERPYIEDVLDKYSHIDNLTTLAIGSVHWQPPVESLTRLISKDLINERSSHRYGNIEGYTPLRDALRRSLTTKGLVLDGLDIAVTAGGNQAFTNVALALCDSGDNAGNTEL